MRKSNKIEAVFWSIALPGFGQLLNGQIIKGMIFIFLEFLINVMSSFNKAIMLSFLGKISEAVQIIDYQWLMFYPCVYMFAMYDAYKAAGDHTAPLSFFPFVFGAYFVTVGLMYSTKFTIFSVLFGPVFLPMLFLIPGLLVGFMIRFTLKKYQKNNVLHLKRR